MINENTSTILIDKKFKIVSTNGNFFNFFYATKDNYFYDIIKSGKENFDHMIERLRYQETSYCMIEITNKESNSYNCFVRARKLVRKRAAYEIIVKEADSFYDEYVISKSSTNILKSVLTMNNCIIFEYDYETDKLVVYSGDKVSTLNLKDYMQTIKLVDPIKYESIKKENDIATARTLEKFEYKTTNLFNFKNCLVNARNIFKDEIAIKCVGLVEETIFEVDESDLYALANLDYTTKLINKSSIMDYAKKLVDEKKQGTTLMIMDIDDFKDINDNYGHMYGDKILYLVADIFKKAVGPGGYVGRIGGDEFMAVIPRCLTTDEIRSIARPARLEVQWLATRENIDIQTACSIGIARYPIDAKSYDELFMITDRCLYVAKDKGKNKYVFQCESAMSYKLPNETIGTAKRRSKGHDTALIVDICYKSIMNNTYDDFGKLCRNLSKSYGLSRMLLYYGKDLNLFINIGDEPILDNGRYCLDEEYLENFDENNFFFLDNVLIYELSEPMKLAFYEKNQIKSAMQYLIKDDDGQIIGLISAEKSTTAATWRGEAVSQFVIIAKCAEIGLKRSKLKGK